MWSDDVVRDMRREFEALGDAQRAPQMQAYMKDVAPFLGLSAATRRRAQRTVWRAVGDPRPEDAQVPAAARALLRLPEREFHYAAAELCGHWVDRLDPGRLDTDIREFLTTRPWWDTVDLWGSAVITPMVHRHQELTGVMWRWNGSGDQWLVRASIQHQRGLKAATDVPLLLALCEPHANDRRFWVAKAIGWALRDTCQVDVGAVREFVTAHPDLSAVARREARRGIDRCD